MPELEANYADQGANINRKPGVEQEPAPGLFELYAADGDEGLAVEALEPGTVLDVTTCNSRYRLVVLDADGNALVSGGWRFPDPIEVRIEGSTAGGRALRLGWIGVGLRLEMRMGTRTITTSTIRSIRPAA